MAVLFRYSNLKQFLVLRYCIALSLVFGVLLATLLIFTRQISLSEHDAYIINTSGMQRMLSQRIALMTKEIYDTHDPQAAAEYAAILSKAIQKMSSNHEILIRGKTNNLSSTKMSSQIYALYFADNGVDHLVHKYISTASAFLSIYKDNGLQAAQKSPLALRVSAIERSGLLDQLDKVVFQYQEEATNKILYLKKIEVIVFFLGAALLIFEALCIFHPMAVDISQKHEELTKINEIKDKELMEFSYRISHDLRAPVVSSSGLIRIAEDAVHKGDSETARQAFSYVKKALSDLEKLIEDLVTLTKMKMIEVPDEEIFIPDLIQNAVMNVKNMPESNHVDIQMKMNIPSACMIKRILLTQILENLISNALKYSDPEKEKNFVLITASQKGKMCSVSIIDNGIGIPESYRGRVFGIFERFHPEKAFGSGLGLYLAAQNARALNGMLDYIALENGSEFRLTFPITKTEKQKEKS